MVRLVLLHHAGGSRLLYRRWERWLPDGWEVLALDAPGRGLRHDLPAVRDVDAMVDHVMGEALAGLDRPLALFGHSMGALVAAKVTNRLLDGGGPAPVWLGLSGWGARRPDGFVDVSDNELRARLNTLGGTSTGLLTDPDHWRLVGPLLRADLEVVASCDPDADRRWLEVPLSLYGGRSDVLATADRLTDLAGTARRPVGLHLYHGDHFYLNHHAGDVARQIATDVLAAIAATTSTKGM